MKILVTGANGQVGKHLGQALSKSPWSFMLLARSDLDIRCKQSVFKLITDYAPDVIINAAAYTAVDKAEADLELTYAINVHGAGLLASAADSINAAIIHLSTDYVFSGDKILAYKEDDTTAPVNTYGRSKCAGESEVIQHNPKHIILRTSWVFSEHGNNFLQTMLHLGMERAEIAVVNDQVGGPTYAGDLAQTILKMIAHYEKNQRLDWGIYHYCGYPYLSWFEFAQEIFTWFALPHQKPLIKPICTADYPTAAKRPHNSRLNCAKIHTAYGINPSDWKSAIENLSRYNDR